MAQINSYLKHFDQIDNREADLVKTIQKQCESKTINPQFMTIQQLSTVLQGLNIKLKSKQLHELFLFSTSQNAKNQQKRIISIAKNKKISISLQIVAKWLLTKINKNKIEVSSFQQKSRSQSTRLEQLKVKFPHLHISKPHDRVKFEVQKVLHLFEKMEKERQNMGIIPVAVDSDDEEKDNPERQPTSNIHYDADFSDVNQRIFKLRSEAEHRIRNIIYSAKEDKKIRKQVEKSIEKYRNIRTEANQKIGRQGAMKAHKRLIDKTKEDVEGLQRWRKKHCKTLFK